MATSDIYTVAGSLTPCRHALRFLGGDVDDGVTVNGLVTGSATSIVQHNDTYGTITARIMVPDLTGTYTIFSMGDNDSADSAVQFTIAAGKLQYKNIDAASTRVDIITTNVVLKAHTWHHVAFVVGLSGTPRVYVDGEEITAITLTTATELTQWADDNDALDNGCIGALYSNNAYTQEFKGYISDVKVWSGIVATASLTSEQVKNDYCGVTNTTSLLAHYTFDGTVTNSHAIGTFDGTIVGAIIYTDANEFTSRLSFGCGTPVSGDNISIAASDGLGIATIIQAA